MSLEQNKYYTPTIEEFYVGFEYKAKPKGSQETNYIDFIWLGNNSLLNEFKISSIKVKYLDQEDIESLGFINQNIKHERLIAFKLNNKELWFNKESYRIRIGNNLIIDKNTLEICNELEKYPTTYPIIKFKEDFDGTIKNINELKKVLQFLNIK